MPDRVNAPVVPWLDKVASDVAFDASNVAPAAAVLVMVTVSMLVNAVGVAEAVITPVNSSVPKPPSKRSPEFRVCSPPVLRPPSKVSLPDVPVKVFEPVVSVLIYTVKKSLKNNNLAQFFGGNPGVCT